MNDQEIIQLFFQRDQQAIPAAQKQYGAYCRTIAANLLKNPQDCEECLSDAMYQAWVSIPPAHPERLGPFLGKITRNLALNYLRSARAKKRGGNAVTIAIEELGDTLPAGDDLFKTLQQRQLTALLERFLDGLPQEKRVVFVLRYWYLDPVSAIAKRMRCGESRIKSMLYRTRKELKHYLEQEGIYEETTVI